MNPVIASPNEEKISNSKSTVRGMSYGFWFLFMRDPNFFSCEIVSHLLISYQFYVEIKMIDISEKANNFSLTCVCWSEILVASKFLSEKESLNTSTYFLPSRHDDIRRYAITNGKKQ